MMTRLLTFIGILLLPFGIGDDLPQFKGGSNGLNSFITDNLIYPEYSRQNCISGVIQVSFHVNKLGKVYNVKVHKGLGVDLDEEAVRVVKLTSGKWTVPSGYNEANSMLLPVRFNAQDTHCQTINRTDIATAVQAYRSRQGLVDAVTNYYTNKYLGKADTTKEQLIVNIKKQLGFDDDYANQVMEQADRKYKEGDHDGACEDWLFVRNIGSHAADKALAQNCH